MSIEIKEQEFVQEVVSKFKEDSLTIDVVNGLYAYGLLVQGIEGRRIIELMLAALVAENCEDEDVLSAISVLSEACSGIDADGVIENGLPEVETTQEPSRLDKAREYHRGFAAKYGTESKISWVSLVKPVIGIVIGIAAGAYVGYKAGEYVGSKQHQSV